MSEKLAPRLGPTGKICFGLRFRESHPTGPVSPALSLFHFLPGYLRGQAPRLELSRIIIIDKPLATSII